MLSTTTHPDYTLMKPALDAVRDAVLGSFFVKREGYVYLPHPSKIDQTSQAAIQRYEEYVAGAEFDEIPQQTLKGFLGRMKFADSEFEFDNRLAYLIENADNDGVPLTGQIEQVASNVMQFGYHILVAEYLNADKARTQAEAKKANVRAAIKSYSRDSLLDWSFRRINGVMQLSYLKFFEKRNDLDPTSGTRKEYIEYFVMSLDDDGRYYWQKFDDDTVTQQSAERNYVNVQGSPLRWLPVEIVADVKVELGKLPLSLGIVSPIATACLDRYRVSADYKETMKNICPTSYTTGWTAQGWEEFQLMNQNREYIAFGARAMNNLPQGVEMGTLNPSISLEGFERYFEENKQKIIALGGIWPDAGGQSTKTATQAENEASEITSRLVSIANNLESSYRRAVLYCGVLEGIYSQTDIEQQLDNVLINLPSDFARAKLTPAEQKAILDNLLGGVYSRAEAVRLLVRGGCTVSDVETILGELDEGA